MRKQDRVVLWPAYFDSTKTRTEGRRVPKNLAVPSPKLEELQRAAERMGISGEAVIDAKHPCAAWQKTGMIVVSKKGSKTQIIQGIAKELSSVRKQI